MPSSLLQSELIIKKININGYENVLEVINKKFNLHAIISIHDTTLGPALGGVRIYPYKTFDDALLDVLRLSKGMTYKSAITELGLGGGKSVIIADPKTDKTEELLLAMGEAINSLNGKYICAEDSGCTLEDLEIVNKKTPYVVGLGHDKSSGDPSRFTAWGTFRGIQAALKWVYDSESLVGKKIAIQGFGSVGKYLAEILFWTGAELIVTDVDEERVKKANIRYGAKVVKPDEIYDVECDVFAPCAMGGVINDETINRFKCKAIAGCANNQLLEDRHADELTKRSILYTPDYVINAGGLFNVSFEITKEGYNPQDPRDCVHNIYETLMSVFKIAKKNNVSTQKAANTLAEYKIKGKIGQRKDGPYFHKPN